MENGGKTEEGPKLAAGKDGNHTQAADEIDSYVSLMDCPC